jgi:tRNA (guanine37-N1)-methyltransferase
MSGHHAHIERWRREQSLRLTAVHRPELLVQARLTGKLNRDDEALLKDVQGEMSTPNHISGSKKL